MWALRGLRNGVLTTRWPDRPDGYATATRGPAAVLSEAEAGAISVADADVALPGRGYQPGPAGAQCESIRAAAFSAAGASQRGRTFSAGLPDRRVPPAAGRR